MVMPPPLLPVDFGFCFGSALRFARRFFAAPRLAAVNANGLGGRLGGLPLAALFVRERSWTPCKAAADGSLEARGLRLGGGIGDLNSGR